MKDTFFNQFFEEKNFVWPLFNFFLRKTGFYGLLKKFPFFGGTIILKYGGKSSKKTFFFKKRPHQVALLKKLVKESVVRFLLTSKKMG